MSGGDNVSIQLNQMSHIVVVRALFEIILKAHRQRAISVQMTQRDIISFAWLSPPNDCDPIYFLAFQKLQSNFIASQFAASFHSYLIYIFVPRQSEPRRAVAALQMHAYRFTNIST